MPRRKSPEELIQRLDEERDWLKARLSEVRDREAGSRTDETAKSVPAED
jgi:hypothetical protein